MGSLESFLHDSPEHTPTLIKAAMAHVQFETIHPFLDGNGRIGRLLVTLILFAEGVLAEPILYLSLYFKTHRSEYYERLQAVRTEGAWEGWLEFFLKGVKDTSEQALDTARRLVDLFERDTEKIKTELGRQSHSALMVHREMQKDPILAIPETAELTGLSLPTVSNIMKRLEALGMVRGARAFTRKRFFFYEEYMSILREGVEPIK